MSSEEVFTFEKDYTRKRPDGYVDVWEPDHPLARSDGYVFQHRKILWDAGILADPTKQVHHLNHIKDDNRLENLKVVSIEEHPLEHDLVGITAENSAKTHCVNGHKLSGDNIYKSQLPYRICKVCARERARKRYETHSR